MLIGIVTDIHEDVAGLRRALSSLRRAGAERIVSLGDVCEDGERIVETCQLLEEAAVLGVWGNHDFGLCTSPLERLEPHFDHGVLKTMRAMVPSLVIEECRFAHIKPGLDPNDFGDLWNSYGAPVEPDRLTRIWSAVPQRRMFMGHLHRWFATTPEGAHDWAGERTLTLAAGRQHLVVVGAVCDGCWALFDTASGRLIPNA